MVAGTGRGNIVGFPRGSLFSFNFQGLNSNGLPTFDFGLYPSNKGANSEISGADFWMHNIQNHTLFTMALLNPNI